MPDKDRVFQILCDHCCSVMDGWIPYPSTCIAGSTGWKLYYVRKLLKQLKDSIDKWEKKLNDLRNPILD